MRHNKYQVYLTAAEKDYLKQMVKSGTAPARQIQRAHILLKADVSEGQGWKDRAIRETFQLARNTVSKIRKRFSQVGLMETIQRQKPQRDYVTRLDGEQEAHLVALACSTPPEGHARWTLRLLAERMVVLEYVESLSYETVRQVLKKRSATLAQADVVHSTAAGRGLRGAHGGPTGCVSTPLRPAPTRAVYG